MKTSLVLTCIGPDRPGLVESLARVVAEHDGNWIESRMAHLAGKFAGVLRVEIDPAGADALAGALGRLADGGLRVAVEQSPPAEPSPTRVIRLSLVGQDRPGIVRDIARVLAGQGVNVEELETACAPTPESGGPLFTARARLCVPPDLPIDDLRAGLEQIANDLMVDVDLEADD